MYLALKTVV